MCNEKWLNIALYPAESPKFEAANMQLTLLKMTAVTDFEPHSQTIHDLTQKHKLFWQTTKLILILVAK